jgi:hypothetical protein
MIWSISEATDRVTAVVNSMLSAWIIASKSSYRPGSYYDARKFTDSTNLVLIPRFSTTWIRKLSRYQNAGRRSASIS